MIDGFEHFNEENIPQFKEFLENQLDGEDSLLKSTAYLLLTGRHGLWIARNSGSYLVACHHPNKNGTVLVLPPTHGFDPHLAKTVCSEIAEQGYKVGLGRIHSDDEQKLSSYSCFVKVDEEVLDWKYPCLLLDNQALSQRKGKEFTKFRELSNRIDREAESITIVRVNQKNHLKHKPDAENLIREWANNVAQESPFDVNMLYEPNAYAYNMARFDMSDFRVTLIYFKNKPIILYTTELARSGNVANGISLSIDRKTKGVSEYAYLFTARSHLEAGYKYTNINGAETEGLNVFRRKLRAPKKIHLSSYAFIR